MMFFSDARRLAEIEASINKCAASVQQILDFVKGLTKGADKMAADLTQLSQDVLDNTAVIEQGISLIQGFQGKLADLKAQLDAAATDPTKLAAISASIQKEDAALKAVLTSVGASPAPVTTPASPGAPGA